MPNTSELKNIKLYLTSFIRTYRKHFFGLIMGISFGFLMSRAGATTYDYHAKMFLFEDFQLVIVIATAVVVSFVGVTLFKKYRVKAISTGKEIDFVRKPYKKGLALGALLFGVGWGMTASCPGTIPAMIGEGKVAALFVLLGLLIGTMAYGILQSYVTLDKAFKKNKILEKTDKSSNKS